MAAHNAEIAEAFRKLADLLEIDGENPYRVTAYRRAANTLESLPRDVADMLARGEDLTALPGIGADLAGKIAEMVTTGSLSALDEIETRVPPGLAELLRVPGLGPKRVAAIHRTLGIESLEALEKAARAGNLRRVPGIGAKTEADIAAQLARLDAIERRLRLVDAEPIAAALERWLRAAQGARQVTVAGSFRRRKETVGDLDIVVAADAGPPVIDRFVAHEDVRDIVLRGPTRATVTLHTDFNIDLRVVGEASLGAAEMYFTGARAHTIALRRRAMARGWKLNEYGLFDGAQCVAARTEADIYARLGLPFIDPLLRENRGEIDALNETLDGIRILKSCEVEIDEDGKLDLGSDILRRLDFTVCAIHSGMSASREALTTRVLRAMDDPNFNILAHPTGRLINRRPPAAIDLETVMRAALERGCFLELNAQPSRLDLDDLHCKMARDIGLSVPISTDAHAPGQLDLMRFGVDQAARGWLDAGDVLNTLPLDRLLARLRR